MPANSIASQLVSRMQPCDCVCPTAMARACRGFRSALSQVDPNDSDGIIRAGRNFCFRMSRFCIPKELRIVVERRVFRDPIDLPCPDRKGIMFRTGRRRILGEYFPTSVEGSNGAGLADDDLRGLNRYGRRSSTFGTWISSPAANIRIRVQAAQKSRADMKLLPERFLRLLVTERLQFGLLYKSIGTSANGPATSASVSPIRYDRRRRIRY